MKVHLSKMKLALLFLFTSYMFQSCYDGVSNGVYYYEEISLWEFNIATRTKRKLRSLGTNEDFPIVQYMHHNNGYVYVRYDQFNIFDKNGVEKVVKLDGWFLTDKNVSISPDDKDILFSGVRLSDDGPNPTFSDRGLYRLNLATGAMSMVYKVDGEIPYFPVYSSDGTSILFKVSANYPSRLYLSDRNGGNKVVIDSNDYDLITYGVFNTDNSKVYYLKSPDRLYEYDIASKTRTTLIDHALFDYGEGGYYPYFQEHDGLLYFITQRSDSTFKASHLYTLDLATKEIVECKVSGSPVAFGSNYLLTAGSELVLQNLKTGTVIRIESSSIGDLSNDEKKVIYVKRDFKEDRY